MQIKFENVKNISVLSNKTSRVPRGNDNILSVHTEVLKKINGEFEDIIYMLRTDENNFIRKLLFRHKLKDEMCYKLTQHYML